MDTETSSTPTAGAEEHPYTKVYTSTAVRMSSSTSRPSSQHSGSDYSSPSTPDASRPSSLSARKSLAPDDAMFEEVSLNSRPNSYNAKIAPIKTSFTGKENSHPLIVDTPPRSQSPLGSDYSGSPGKGERSPTTPTMPVSPITPYEARMSINSLNSFDLADVDYGYVSQANHDADTNETPRGKVKANDTERADNVWGSSWARPRSRRPTLTRPSPPTRQSTLFDMSKDLPLTPTTPTTDTDAKAEDNPSEEHASGEDNTHAYEDDQSYDSSAPTLNVIDTSSVWRTERFSSLGAPTRVPTWPAEDELAELDWSTLDRNEEQEKEDKEIPEGAEDESTRFLLARLEQENAKFAADPKASISKRTGRQRSQTRPPSMAHLKKLVAQDAPSIRYSLVSDVEAPLPDEPPAMTELEFWAALVQDYPSTASRLPTLTATKIRAGIPPPLRGVVWTSMSGARDKDLEEAFETLQNEESPYEGIINKDVGRSFPGVELFRDAEGEGQKMLGRVLKCFSLHDKDIGYCQGLGFLVGPLLMNMGEKDAFCALVRLMDHYALRPSFLPSLSGLHMRIFQFSNLLKQHMPALSEHLSSLGVEPAYLSQWFLSCFAVTCPLPMLFRIYDVIFAEGANETVMRVALALFRRNEEKMMASHEFEDVMQLLLGRALWDVYACNADELVDDFTSLGNIITYDRLAELEREFESKSSDAVGQSAGFLPDVQAAASRFLGRLWTPGHALTPSKGVNATLSPNSTEKTTSTYGYLSRPSAFLRRSPSKTSLGAINDSNSSESSGGGSTSTAPTDGEIHDAAARDGQADSMSMRSKSESMFTISGSTSAHAQQLSSPPGTMEEELQTEIEDLLMALSEMQREHAQMAAMLQREREERTDDQRVVKKLVNKLVNDEGERKATVRRSMPPPPRPNSEDTTSVADKRKTLPPGSLTAPVDESLTVNTESIVVGEHQSEVEGLVRDVQSRLNTSARFSASFETRAQLRSALARTREQLSTAETQVKDLSERVEFAEVSLANHQAEDESLQAEVEELRTRVNDDFKEKKKLELQIENLQIQIRMEAKAVEKKLRAAELARTEISSEVPTIRKPSSESPARSRTGSVSSNAGNSAGLRELKLGRRESVSSVASIRSMRSQRQTGDEWPRVSMPPADHQPSPPRSPEPDLTPTTPTILPTLPQTPNLAVPTPSGPYFARRTTSLAAKEVFATPQHEPVPEDALLLELVNAKTAEATARQEVDEMKRSMQMQKRRADETLLELQAAVANAKLEAEKAREEAEQARQEAKMARAEVFDASELSTPMTPAANYPFYQTRTDSAEKSPSPPTGVYSASPSPSPVEPTEQKDAEAGSAGFGGWSFWSRRNASATKSPGA